VCGLFGVLLCCVGLATAFNVWVGVSGESRYGYVSISWFGQSVQLGLGYVNAQKIFFWWFPMYWAYHNFKLCVICALNMPKAFRKCFERF
jgi:hypothetical protein